MNKGCCCSQLSAQIHFHILVMRLSPKEMGLSFFLFVKAGYLVLENTGLNFLPPCNVPDKDSRVSVRGKEVLRGRVCRWLRCQVFTSLLELDWGLQCMNGPVLHCHSPSHHTGPGLEETQQSEGVRKSTDSARFV